MFGEPDTQRVKQRAWLAYSIGGILVTAAYLFVPGLRLGPIFNLIAISSPIAILIAVRLWKPQTRLPWYLFALGMTFFVAGDVITYNYDRFFGTELPFPSVGDVFYLSVYPCLVAGILLLVRRSNPGGDRDSVIDSLIVAIGVGTISWVFLLSPLAHDSVSTLLQKVTAMGYPVMDLILLTVVVRLAIGGGRRAASFYLMAGAALALFATDFAYSYFSVQGIVYDQAGYLEAGWATLLHPVGRGGPARIDADAVGAGRRRRPAALPCRLTILALASLLAPSVMMIQHLRNATEDLPVLIGAAGVLFLLVVMRIAGSGPEAGTVGDPGTGAPRRGDRPRDRHQPGGHLRGDVAGRAFHRGGELGDPCVGRRGSARGFHRRGRRGRNGGDHRADDLALDAPRLEARPTPFAPVLRGADLTKRNSPDRSPSPTRVRSS